MTAMLTSISYGRQATGLVLTVLLLAGCSSGPTTGGFTPTEGIVYGDIRNEAGQLQQDATVEVVTYHETCNAANPAIRGVPTLVPDGRYRFLLRGAHFTEFAACLVVNASVSSSTTTLQGTVRDHMLTMRNASMGPPDSLKIDVVVRVH
jgi:hypothetical protein